MTAHSSTAHRYVGAHRVRRDVARLAPVAPRDAEPPGLTYDIPRGIYVRGVKPVVDRVAAAVLCLFALPVIAVVALAVRISLGSPVVFRQRRVGRGGREFDVFKFRTMTRDRRDRSESVPVDRRHVHKSDADPRHTRVGRFLRRWSLDELPQLWNVLRGDMSMIGPRPELVDVVNHYEAWQHRRHSVKPGLMGLWQVTRRGSGLMHLHTDVDLLYVDAIGFWTDVTIVARTVPAMFRRGGS